MSDMHEGKGQILEGWRYGVFLSFYGKDTRKNFTDHLYHALRNSGIYTFRDNEELSRGGVIGLELQESIESSKILVVVFSKNYASSTWCLEELLHIVKSSKSNLRQKVFPIFHDIDPSDIRRQEGTIAESFDKHESRYPLDKVQSWRDALTATANLSGWNLRNSHEAESIKDIVREIRKKLFPSSLHVASYPVGIRPRVLEIGRLLSVGSDDVRVVGICGMGGIGKTTIAKAAYNEFSYHFDGQSFLSDFREFSKKPEGKFHLLQLLLSDIFKRHDMQFNRVDNATKEILSMMSVLVVIDDVEDLVQFNSVAIGLRWFGPGSRIIMTTRNKHLLEQLGANEIFFPQKLDAGESLELLSWHAFRTIKPPEQFCELSRNVVEYCGGLPLAIEVLGAFLFKRSIPEWKDTLELLKRTPDDTIQKKLRISFDGLSNVQKDIFLDIACFFSGMGKVYVTQILDGCGFSPGVGLNVLMERCLVSEIGDKLMMHDLIRDMGREIVRQESPKSCGKRSRLWDPDDVIDVLRKYSGTDAVEGLSLKAQVQDVGKLDAKSFSTLRELRFLRLSHVNLKGGFEDFPKGLRSLCWYGFPSESIPANFCLQSLAFMDMRYSNLRWFWKAQEAQPLKKLKFLDLSYSFWLRETPNFSYLPKLEKLLMIGCKNLVFVHKSIGILCNKLILVNLDGCTELEDLPTNFYKLKSLETLILSGCTKLKKLDDALGEMEALETLLVDCTAITEVPSSIFQLKKLKTLSLCGSKESWNDYMPSKESPQPILRFLGSLQGFSCLGTLRLRYCNLTDELVPKDLGSLPCLKELDLSGNSFCHPQTDFASLSSLHTLLLNYCSKLKTIVGLPRTLHYLWAHDCFSLERTPDLSECSSLRDLILANCVNLVETPGLEKLKQPMSIRLHMCLRLVDTLRDSFLEECAASSYGGIYHGGSVLPNWLRKKSGHRRDEYWLSFIVPKTPHLGFRVLILYMRGSKLYQTIRVTNHTKGTTWFVKASAAFEIYWQHENFICAGYFLDESFLGKGDQVEAYMSCFSTDDLILELGFSLSEAKEVNAVSLLKATIAFLEATSDPTTVSTHEHSTGILGKIQSIHENEEGSSPKGLRLRESHKANKKRRWKYLRATWWLLYNTWEAYYFRDVLDRDYHRLLASMETNQS